VKLLRVSSFMVAGETLFNLKMVIVGMKISFNLIEYDGIIKLYIN